MTELRPADNADAARWLLAADVDWSDLVRFGPPCFDAYARVAFTQPSDDVDPVGELPSLRTALMTLTSFTATPDSGYAAIWEGWSGGWSPRAPRVAIPHREMLLFTGPLTALRDAPALAWLGTTEEYGFQEPHLVWPSDRAWCLACDVDEEIEFTVGCSAEAAEVLARDLPGAVRLVDYGESTPLDLDAD